MRDSRIRRLYYKAIREVFLTDWNPIGVDGLPEDEYDNYIPAMYGMLVQGTSEREIADYIQQVETEKMEFNPDRSHLEAVARKLLLIPAALKS